MILNTITLHNFMSYGDAKLDCSAFAIACLSGLNGAGKSAILDAITWALWESARSTSDELIRGSEQEMWVDLTFELDGEIFRVRRSRQRSTPRAGARILSRGTLELQVLAGDPGLQKHWKSLTCCNMKETQIKINELLHMDYDTFINSVYLRQGRADEFTTRPPAERKQVLAEILGLNYFDKLQEAAREEARLYKTKVDFLQIELARYPDVPTRLQAAIANLQATENQRQQISEQLEQSLVKLLNYQNQLADMQAIDNKLEPTRLRLDEMDKDILLLAQTEEKLLSEKSALLLLLREADSLQNASENFHLVKSQVEKCDAISLELHDYNTSRLELKSKLASMRSRLEVELEHLGIKQTSLKNSREELLTNVGDAQLIGRNYEEYKQLMRRAAEMARKQEHFVRLGQRAEQLHTTIMECRLYLEAELGQKQHALKEWKALLENKTAIAEEQASVMQSLDELDKLEVEFDSVEDSGLRLKQEIDTLKLQIQALLKKLAENAAKVKELTDNATQTSCPLCAAPIVDRLAVMERYALNDGQINQEISELETQAAALERRRAQLRLRYAELRRKLDTRKQLDRQVGELNARMSALLRAQQNIEQLQEELTKVSNKLKTEDYASVEKESLINIKTEMHKLDFDTVIYSSLQAQLTAKRHAEFRFQQLKRDQAQLSVTEEELAVTTERMTAIEHALSANDFGLAEQSAIQRLDELIARQPYDRGEHQALRDKLSELLPLADKFKQIEQARQSLPAVETELSARQKQLTEKRAQHCLLSDSVTVWKEKLSGRQEISRLSETLAEQITAQRVQLTELDRQATIQTMLNQQLVAEEALVEAKQVELTQSIAAMNDHEFLSEAFGKRGIQAIIIENAVPEIEAEANSILSRLSDNQMTVALVTQQKTRAGNLIEALEIVVADEMGTRNYELYSGGEAFKINFAIRVALSRLLARRAGAKLQSLIVDEGFGSQDEISRGRLVKALNAIRPDFARILVVTHISEIKEMFPVQIQVQKNNGISTVNLLHAY